MEVYKGLSVKNGNLIAFLDWVQSIPSNAGYTRSSASYYNRPEPLQFRHQWYRNKRSYVTIFQELICMQELFLVEEKVLGGEVSSFQGCLIRGVLLL